MIGADHSRSAAACTSSVVLLLRNLAQLATPSGTGAPLRGAALAQVEVLEDAFVLCDGESIEVVGRMSSLPALADDSGLVVDALDGAPGIYSARWAGPEKNFRHAMEKVEGMLRERDCFRPEQRKAHFVSLLAVAWPDGHVEEFEGRVDGTLVWPPRGDKGFGYDPMFLPDGETLTFGEMSSEDKHGLPPRGRGLSHRARAFIKLAEACLGAR